MPPPLAQPPVAPAPARTNPAAQRARTDSSLRSQPNVQGSINVSVASIIARLPKELMQRVRQADALGAEIAIPLQRIVSQIASGAVKITFGELRQAAPDGTFSYENDRDSAAVDVPLNEILPQLDPALLPRRATQKQVVVPNEVIGPFGGKSQVNFATTLLKPATPAQPAPAQAATGGTTRMYRRNAAPVAAAVAPPVAAVPAPAPLPSARTRVNLPQPAAQPVPQNERVIIPFQPAKPAPAPAQSAYQFQPSVAFAPAQPQPVRPAAPVVPARPPVVSLQPPVVSQPEQFEPDAAAPSLVPAQQEDDLDTALFTPSGISIPQPAVAYSPQPHPQAAPVAPIISPIAPAPEPQPEPIRFNPAPAPAPVAAPIPAQIPSSAGETRFLTLAISEVAGGWPAPIQEELMAHQLTTSSIALPFGVIEVALKQGKVALSWRIIRSWIKPPVRIGATPNDAIMLELPLRVLAPLFMAEAKAGRPQKKVAVDESIPNLFSNRIESAHAMPVVPGAVASAPAAAESSPVVPLQAAQPLPKPAPIAPGRSPDTNYFARPDGEHPEEAAPPVKKGPSPGTAFLQRYATPNEIVGKAAALQSVDGALIALPDGLMVASRVPPNMNAETIAGFLPQIFNRVSQCTKELRMGELNNLNFTVGNVPWKIFKVGAIFFAAFGHPGQPLPTAQLAAIAAELDRKAK